MLCVEMLVSMLGEDGYIYMYGEYPITVHLKLSQHC